MQRLAESNKLELMYTFWLPAEHSRLSHLGVHEIARRRQLARNYATKEEGELTMGRQLSPCCSSVLLSCSHYQWTILLLPSRKSDKTMNKSQSTSSCLKKPKWEPDLRKVSSTFPQEVASVN